MRPLCPTWGQNLVDGRLDKSHSTHFPLTALVRRSCYRRLLVSAHLRGSVVASSHSKPAADRPRSTPKNGRLPESQGYEIIALGYKMNIGIAFLLLASTFCGTATADVYKCENPPGKTIYSDEPCGRNAKVMSNLGANTLPAMPVPIQSQPTTLAQTQRPFEERVAPVPPAFVADLYTCNLARRNADTTASSSSADPKRVQLAEREANIACYGTVKAGEIEQARAGATKVIINPDTQPALRPSRFITHCAGAVCFDYLGGRHPRLQP